MGALKNREDGYISSQLAEKANIAQTDWITPTLQNGWSSASAGRTLQYRKNSIGEVIFTGVVTGGSTTAALTLFTLPAGYRSASTKTFVISSAGSFDTIAVNADGTVKLGANASGSGLYFGNIAFKAEA